MSGKESLRKQLQNKAKSALEIQKQIKKWENTFREGAMGNHDAYNKARDTRPEFEERRWVKVKDAEAVVDAYLASSPEKKELLAYFYEFPMNVYFQEWLTKEEICKVYDEAFKEVKTKAEAFLQSYGGESTRFLPQDEVAGSQRRRDIQSRVKNPPLTTKMKELDKLIEDVERYDVDLLEKMNFRRHIRTQHYIDGFEDGYFKARKEVLERLCVLKKEGKS